MINYPNSSASARFRNPNAYLHVLARKQLCFAAGGLWAALDYFFFEANGMCLSQCCIKFDIEKG